MKKLPLLFAIAMLSLASCGDRSESTGYGYESAKQGGFMNTGSDDAPPPPPMDDKVRFASAATPDEPESATSSNSNGAGTGLTTATIAVEKPVVKIAEKIKKTADVNLSVQDYKEARVAIDKIVKTGNGYISGENEQNSTYSITNSMTIRVANKDFDAMVSNLTGVANHVNSKNIYMEDVTAQFVDITARLKTKKEVEKRYLDLLQKAVKVTDILEVEEHLRFIREEIEAKEGQLKLLNDQVAYSTINLNFTQSFEYTPQDEPGFFGRMGHAFGNGWKGFLSFLIGLVYVWPLWLILGVTAYFTVKLVKRKLKK